MKVTRIGYCLVAVFIGMRIYGGGFEDEGSGACTVVPAERLRMLVRAYPEALRHDAF